MSGIQYLCGPKQTSSKESASSLNQTNRNLQNGHAIPDNYINGRTKSGFVQNYSPVSSSSIRKPFYNRMFYTMHTVGDTIFRKVFLFSDTIIGKILLS